ncbi:phospholipid-transporting ATPase ABCA7 isoform X2 [Monodelphis domestica]|uniref:phospholipid-transporting ATPase ABCA7 isoform X2 n=1 Tax=Monodelphis domestica TaxID=13616 RepID=UPI0024E1AA80|nr:phospholipid-transporting ATPase ABCA7 isoform X2 [Monodelphis domestica]
MSFWTQLMLLLWKNYTYRKRHRIQLFIEILWPLFLFLILITVRQFHLPSPHHECHFPNKPMPSAGMLPWLQGIVCNMGNPCHRYATPGESPNVLSNFNESLISRFLADTWKILLSPKTSRTLRSFQKLMPDLETNQRSALPLRSYLVSEETFLKFLQNKTSLTPSLAEELLKTPLSLRGMPPNLLLTNLCNSSMPNIWFHASESLKKGLCALSPSEFQAIRATFLTEADPALLNASSRARPNVKAVSEFLEAWNATIQEISSLTSGAELLEELQRPPGANGPLEGMSRILCGKSEEKRLGIPSLSWLENENLKAAWDQNQERQLLSTDTDFTPFCRKLITSLEEHYVSRMIWWRLKPLVRGKILYTPDTLLTHRIMKEVNQTFHSLTLLKDLFDLWEAFSPQISQFLSNSTNISLLEFIQKMFHISSWEERQNNSRPWPIHTFWKSDGNTSNWNNTQKDLTYIVNKMGKILQCISLDKIEAFSTEDDLSTRALDLVDKRRFWAAIVFLGLEEGRTPSQIRFKIRMDIDDVTKTNRISSRIWDPGPAADPFMDLRYVWGGFVYLQDIVEGAVIRVLSGTTRPLSIYVQQMPYPCFVDDVFLRMLNRLMPLFLTLSWIYSVALIVKGVVQEKEDRLRDTMLTMGLSRGVLWSSWFISSLCPFLVSISFLVLILRGLLSPVTFGFGCEYLSLYEVQGVGIQWHNLGQSPLAGDTYNLALSQALLIIDAGLYSLATWYIETVFPGQYGVPQPWNFPFRKSYWYGEQTSASQYQAASSDVPPQVLVEETSPELQVGVSLRNLVKYYPGCSRPALRGLSLDFYEGHITAFLGHNGAGKTTTLSILSGLFPPTQGSVFILGQDVSSNRTFAYQNMGICPQHNVLFDTLTVEEHIWFYGCLKGLSKEAVAQELPSLLKDVGLSHKREEQTCHLSGGMQRKLSIAIAFVGNSRVVILDEPTAGVDPFSRRDIWELLLKYRHGRTVILSTHYMDEAELMGDRVAVIARGQLRCCGSPLFLKSRLGTGYYLTMVKRQPTEPPKAGTDHGTLEETRSKDLKINKRTKTNAIDVVQLLAFVQKLVPRAQLTEDLGHEVVLTLPGAGAHNGTFGKLFQELDSHREELGISDYGISDTTLEEIFMKMATDNGADTDPGDGKSQSLWQIISSMVLRESQKNGEDEAKENRRAGASSSVELQALNRMPSTSEKLQDWALVWSQFCALFIKRFHCARRSRRGLFAQIVLPAFFVGLSLFFSLFVPPFDQYPPQEIMPSMFGPQISFFSENDPGNPIYAKILNALLTSSSFCVKNSSDPRQNCTDLSNRRFWTPPVSEAVAKLFATGNWTMQNPSPECKCSSTKVLKMLPNCPEAAGGLPPPQILMGQGSIMQNLTGRNISDYLVKTYTRLIQQGLKSKKYVSEIRYGGFSLEGKPNTNMKTEKQKVLNTIKELQSIFYGFQNKVVHQLLQNLSTMVEEIDSCDSVKVWFNNKGWHSMVAFINLLNNGFLQANLPPGTDPEAYNLTIINHPLSLTKEQLSEATLMASSVDVLVSICVLFAMSFIPASFVLFLIEDRVSQAKHLQFLAGLPPNLYWLGNFAWDMCNYLIPTILVVLIFLGFQQKAYVSPQNLPALLLLLLLYGWSITPLMYPASFLFSVPSTAYVILTCLNLFIGINGSMATFVLELLSNEKLQYVNRVLKKIFLIFPHFCLGRGLIDMVRNQAMSDAFLYLGDNEFESPLNWNLVGKNLFAMGLQGPIFLLITLLLQHRVWILPRPISPQSSWKMEDQEEDEDVQKEQERVHQGATQKDVFVLKDLTKIYPGHKKPAVDHLCLGIPPGECFGLLGVNGAGKTTVFRMVTGDIEISEGDAILKGSSILTDLQTAQIHMGYCPQFDATTELLTGREHLEFFSRLRGIPEKDIAQSVELGLTKMGLLNYADQISGSYSGGNKRKLSTAIALVGGPSIIFLDEPTTGMDPQARHFLWNSVLRIVKEGCSVVLTSHSMEECEALCTRLAIMVNGRFRCLGSVQHLKNRFGEGYTVSLRVPTSNPGPVQDFMKTIFPNALLKEHHGCLIRYQLPSGHCPLARIFDELAAHSPRLGIEDFSVTQTTLDQVFIYFAKDQGKEANYSQP